MKYLLIKKNLSTKQWYHLFTIKVFVIKLTQNLMISRFLDYVIIYVDDDSWPTTTFPFILKPFSILSNLSISFSRYPIKGGFLLLFLRSLLSSLGVTDRALPLVGEQ